MCATATLKINCFKHVSKQMKTLNLILLFRKLLLCQGKNLTVHIVPKLTKKFNYFPASDFPETPFANPPFLGMISCFTLLIREFAPSSLI